MPNDMMNITACVRDWILRHDLVEGGEEVSLILEFPSERAANRAVMVLKSEISTFLYGATVAMAKDGPRTMNGIGLRFSYTRRPSQCGRRGGNCQCQQEAECINAG